MPSPPNAGLIPHTVLLLRPVGGIHGGIWTHLNESLRAISRVKLFGTAMKYIRLIEADQVNTQLREVLLEIEGEPRRFPRRRYLEEYVALVGEGHVFNNAT